MDVRRPVLALKSRPEAPVEHERSRGAAPPVFSFRRSNALLRQDQAVESRLRSAAGSPDVQRREDQPLEDLPAHGSTSSAPSALPSPRDTAGAVVELLDSLATELLAGPVAEPVGSSAAGVPGLSTKVHALAHESGLERRGHSAETAGSRTESSPGSSSFHLAPHSTSVATASDAAESRLRSAAGSIDMQRRENLPAHSSTSLRPRTPSASPPAVRNARETAGVAIELVDALATELLAGSVAEPVASSASAVPGVSTAVHSSVREAGLERRGRPVVAASPQTESSPSSSSLHLAPHSSSAADLNEVALLARHDRALPDLPGHSLARTPAAGPSLTQATVSANLDAETLASMVNEVLAEQARRHGVDL